MTKPEMSRADTTGDAMKCRQNSSDGQCENDAAYRFTWPGSDESVICEEHVGKLRGVANAMGFYIQIRPLGPDAGGGE
jgi:hypothetical protein